MKKGADMAYRCAILDDYQKSRSSSPTGQDPKDVEIKVFTEAVRRSDADTIATQGLRIV